jgi:cathepsin D
LSFPNLSTLKYTPIFDSIINNNFLSKNWFSFYLTDINERSQSQIILGEPSTNIYIGNLNWHKVIQESYWQVEMDDIYIDNKPLKICPDGKPCKLVIDTGTSIMTGPSNDLDILLNSIPLSDCNEIYKMPEIGFKIGDLLYTIKPSEYIIFSQRQYSSFLESEETKLEKISLSNRITTEAQTYTDMNSSSKFKIKENLLLNNFMKEEKSKQSSCRRAFMPLDVNEPRGPLWVLGDIFLRKYFTVFDRDLKRIGIAERRKNAID